MLSSCSEWKIASDTINYLAGGSYGAVYDMVLRKGGKDHQMAVKIISIGRLGLADTERLEAETLAEMTYGSFMAKAKIGPKVYDQFFYEGRAVNTRGHHVEWLWGVILMEKFQGSGADLLSPDGRGRGWGVTPTAAIRAIVIKKMMKLTHRMVDQGLYCWDIKPGNFVVNLNGSTSRDIHVKMIDFGGQFCVFGREWRDEALRELRESAKTRIKPEAVASKDRAKLKQVRKTLMGADIAYFNEVFYYLVMIPFLVLLEDRYVGFDFQKVAHSTLLTLCGDDTLRVAMTLLLNNSPIIFKAFQHYTKKKRQRVSHAQAIPFFASVLDNLCLQIPAEDLPDAAPDRLKAARATRRRVRGRRGGMRARQRGRRVRRSRRRRGLRRHKQQRGGTSINVHSLITPGLQGGRLSLLARSLQKPNPLHERLAQLYDVIT